MSQLPIALQLYTVRDDCSANFPAALKRVAEIGYKFVELAGFNGLSVSQLQAELAANGLSAISAHVGLGELTGDNADQVLADYKAVGASTIVVPYLPAENRVGAAGYKETAQTLSKIAVKAKALDLGLAYHNHNFEFDEKFDGVSGMDILVGETDPSLVKIELDTYWALFAGVDPVGFLKQHPGRFPLLHIKDMDPTDRTFAEVGTGLLPLDAIIAAAPAAGAKYLIVEQDSCKRAPMESITISLTNLKAKGYA